jgi:hypothetical protein
MPVGLAVTNLVELAFRSRNRQTRNRHRLGIVKDSDGIGPGRFVMVGPDALAFRRKRAILFEQ